MNNKYFDGVIQAPTAPEVLDEELKAVALAMPGKVEARMNDLKVADAIDEIFVLLRRANKYIDETMPWALAKDEAKKERLGTVLYNLLEAIRFAAISLKPYLPDTSDRILAQLNTENGGLESLATFGVLPSGGKVGAGEILFARLDPVKKMAEIDVFNAAKYPKAEKKEEKKEEKKPEPAKAPAAESEEETFAEITFDDFAKVELRVAKVLTCEAVPESKKLLNLRLYDGKGERTILSGIAKWYKPEDLAGKHVCIVANLAPRPMLKGKYVSEGMVVSAEDDEGNVTVVTFPESVKPGSLLG